MYFVVICWWIGLDTYTEILSLWWNSRHWLHWKLHFWQVWAQPVILTALEITFLTNFSAASDKSFIKMTTFPFPWMSLPRYYIDNASPELCTHENCKNHDDVIKWKPFSALLAFCAGDSPVTSEFSAQRPVTRSFDVFFHLCPNKQLSKQSWGWWFETPLRSLWRHCNVDLMRIQVDIRKRKYLTNQVLEKGAKQCVEWELESVGMVYTKLIKLVLGTWFAGFQKVHERSCGVYN